MSVAKIIKMKSEIMKAINWINFNNEVKTTGIACENSYSNSIIFNYLKNKE